MLILAIPSLVHAQAAVQREDVEEKYKWDLTRVYETSADWNNEYDEIVGLIPEVETFKGKLGDSPEALLGYHKASERMSYLFERLYVYAGQSHHVNMADSDNNERWQKAQGLGTKISAATSWVEPELLAVGKDEIDGFMKKNDDLAVYRHHYHNLFRTSAHILSEKEERILSLSGDLAAAPRNIFGQMTNADLKFGTFLDSDGNEVEMTQARYGTFMADPDRATRERAYKVYYEGYGQYLNANAAALDGAMKGDWFAAQARGFESCAQRATFSDNVEVELLENLIETVNANMDPVYRYNGIRARIMELDTLQHWDTYVPLIPDVDVDIPYEEAIEIVMNGLVPLGEDYQAALHTAFNSRWIDVYENEGKRSGAYSWGGQALGGPFMLLNYQNKLEDVSTLAHEIGHALHTWHSMNEQPQVYADYTTFVAEVASTTNEAILLNHLLRNEKDLDKKIFLTNFYIKQIMGTVYTQVMFSEFEKTAHERLEAGEALSVNSLNEIYHGLIEKHGGPQTHYSEVSGTGWGRIGHFYRNYYVYKYATSYAAATAFAKKILDEEPGALEKYLTFLKSGSSDYPAELLKTAGVDLTTPGPIQDTCDLLSDLVDDLEKLLAEKENRS